MNEENYENIRNKILNIGNLSKENQEKLLLKVREEYDFNINTLEIVALIRENETPLSFQNNNIIIKLELEKVIEEKSKLAENELINKENINKLRKKDNQQDLILLRKEFSRTKEGFEIINLIDNLQFIEDLEKKELEEEEEDE